MKKPGEPWIRPMLDISTAHLPPKAQANDWPDGFNNVYPYDYGFILHVPEDPKLNAEDYAEDNEESDYKEEAEALVALQVYARSLGCDFIMFDADGEELEGFPTWEA